MAFPISAILGLNAAPFARGLRDAEKAAAQAGSRISQAFGLLSAGPGGIASAVGLGGAFYALQAQMDLLLKKSQEIRRTASLTGLSTDEIQQLTHAASRLGMQADMSGAVGKFAEQHTKLQEALKSGDPKKWNDELLQTLKIYERFGVTSEEMLDDSMAPAIRRIIAGLREMNGEMRGSAETVAIMRHLFGRGGAQLIPALMDKSAPDYLMTSKDIEYMRQYEALKGQMDAIKAKVVLSWWNAIKETFSGGGGAATTGFETPARFIAGLYTRLFGKEPPKPGYTASGEAMGGSSGDAFKKPESGKAGKTAAQVAQELDQARADLIAEKTAKLKEQTQMAQMSRGQKRQYIMDRIAGLQGEWDLDVSAEDQAMRELEIAQWQHMLGGIAGSPKARAFDALARVGGWTAGAGPGSEDRNIARETLKTLRQIEKNTDWEE